MAPRVHHRPVCALCGMRDARTPDDIDGNLVVVCFDCKTPPNLGRGTRPKVDRRARLLRAMERLDGPQRLNEISEALDDDNVCGRRRTYEMLVNAMKVGLVKVTNDGLYSLTKIGRMRR